MSEDYGGPWNDRKFLAGYRSMRNADRGLNIFEREAVRSCLPPLRGARVLDLGCGTGEFANWAADQGAKSVVAVDVSKGMLADGAAAHGVSFVLAAMEEVAFAAAAFDVVVSSMAIHYVAEFPSLCSRVERWLSSQGLFVFSVEHPVATARQGMPGWSRDASGETVSFTVDDYSSEGGRTQEWFIPGVTKYHRTVATYVNEVIAAGFRVQGLLEPFPSPKMVNERPWLRDEARRPAVLVLAGQLGSPGIAG